nr:MAG TPA: hypothetical protein [Inoviridae sp.]
MGLCYLTINVSGSVADESESVFLLKGVIGVSPILCGKSSPDRLLWAASPKSDTRRLIS